MPIEREELEALFNSPNNDVKDGRVKSYEERSQQSDEHLDDLKQNIASNKRPSILEDALENKSKFSMAPKSNDDDEEIVLDDLKGSEDLNFSKKEESSEIISSPEDLKVQEQKIEDNIIKNEDKKEVTNSLHGRIPFDFDGTDEIVSSENDLIVENPEERESSNENNVSEEKEFEEKVEQQIIQSQKKILSEEDMEEYNLVCIDTKYLSDPRYCEFYKQKLRAYKFLKDNVPEINYNKLREQIKDFYVSVHIDGIISLDQFNEKIQQVQAIRNRLTQVRSLCIQNYVPKKRIVKMLEDCLMKESSERSTDKRAGEIQIHLSDMEYDMALIETFMKDVEQIMENITCAHESLSRQITVLQERNKEIQRGQEPYIDTSSDKHDSLLNHSVLDDEEDGNSYVKLNNKWRKM